MEAQEGLERNRLTISKHLLAAFGAFLLRQIKAASNRRVSRPFEVLAFGAKIMGFKRIDFGNPRHIGGERGADRSARSDEKTLGIGPFNQQMGNIISDRIAIASFTNFES